jgi:UDP-N-acetylmuramoyl-tripeptide--D-alanyl-D-alanine ligase
MIPLTLREVAAVVGAVPPPGPDAERPVSGAVRIDSRHVEPGDLFVAFPGAHADGHDFVGQAFERGAAAAIVTRGTAAAGPMLLVTDARDAIQALAADQADRRPSSTLVVGITGSSGKTTTKDLLAQVLEPDGPTIAPPGSFNNELGLPQTVLRADPSTRFLVLEMGARGIGHIAELVRIARPSVGVALNVGSAHVGEFGGPEAIAQAKGEIVEGLPAAGLAVLNADDHRTRAMAARTRARIRLFGESPDADVRAEDVVLDDEGCARFVLVVGEERAGVLMRLPGRHMVSNALAVAAVAGEAGLPPAVIAERLSAAGPRSRWRMEIATRDDGVTVINDAYNANPESVLAALAVVSDRACSGRRIAVLGEMLELGDATIPDHERIGTAAAERGIAVLVAVGRPGIVAALEQGATNVGGTEVRRAADAEEAVVQLSDLAPGDVVLIKASRALGLERVAAALLGGNEGLS